MADLTSTPPVVRARGDGWGGDEARDADPPDRRGRYGYATGFGTCEVEVLRSDDMLEFVAIAGNDAADAEMLGRASPLSALQPALSLGAEYGAWTCVAQEWLTPEARRLLAEYCWIPEITDTDDPDQWRRLRPPDRPHRRRPRPPARADVPRRARVRLAAGPAAAARTGAGGPAVAAGGADRGRARGDGAAAEAGRHRPRSGPGRLEPGRLPGPAPPDPGPPRRRLPRRRPGRARLRRPRPGPAGPGGRPSHWSPVRRGVRRRSPRLGPSRR